MVVSTIPIGRSQIGETAWQMAIEMESSTDAKTLTNRQAIISRKLYKFSFISLSFFCIPP